MDSFICWIGGKRLLRDQIIERFPADIERYIEVFGGAGWVLFRRDKHAALEVYNDVDGSLVNLFRCVKYHAGEVQRELQWYLNSRELFGDMRASEGIEGFTDIQRAARFFVILKSSYGADKCSFGGKKRSLSNAVERLADVQKRLDGVVIERRDFEALIKVYDRPDALFYCDPPYFATEKYYDAYFKSDDHERLKIILKGIKGRFLLSYNDDPFVRELYKWAHVQEVSRLHSLKTRYGAESYKELLISNY